MAGGLFSFITSGAHAASAGTRLAVSGLRWRSGCADGVLALRVELAMRDCAGEG
jgi:hypothetical protein